MQKKIHRIITEIRELLRNSQKIKDHIMDADSSEVDPNSFLEVIYLIRQVESELVFTECNLKAAIEDEINRNGFGHWIDKSVYANGIALTLRQDMSDEAHNAATTSNDPTQAAE